MKSAVVDVGGGMRDVYGAGVYEYCLRNKIHFDTALGISAGAMNLLRFLSGQKGVLYQCYAKYGFDRRYLSFSNFIKNHSYANIDWMLHSVQGSAGPCPVHFDRVLKSGTDFEIGATGAFTGRPVYFRADQMHEDDYWCVAASAALPVFSRPYMHDDALYYDGGISSPIPVRRCMHVHGCDKVVLILTRPRDFYRDPEKDRIMAGLIQNRYPGGARALAHRALVYNKELDQAKELEAQGRVLILAPDQIGQMSSVSKDAGMVRHLYEKGMRDAAAIPAFLSK